MKQCSKCGMLKSHTEFVTKSRNKDGLAAHCKECHKWLGRRYSYGVSQEQFDGLLTQQNGVCALCLMDDWSGRGDIPFVDHNHRTGEVRGLLCNWCNSFLIPILEHSDIDCRAYLDRACAYLDGAYVQFIDKTREHPIAVSRSRNGVSQPVYAGFKQCTGRFGCYMWKPVEMFGIRYKSHGERRPYYRAQCHKCEFFDMAWHRYRITRKEYENLVLSQQGTCAICGVVPDSTLHLDHSESGQYIRGLLCNDCNAILLPALERIRDDWSRFSSRVENYLVG